MIKFKNSEITPEKIYNNRRSFIKNLGLAAGSMLVGSNLFTSADASTSTVSYTHLTLPTNIGV